MKQAEELLYGEFAVALGIEKSDVKGYIERRIRTLENTPLIKKG